MTTGPATVEPAAPPVPAWRMREWPGRLLDLGVVAALLLVGGAVVAGSEHVLPHTAAARIPWLATVVVALLAIMARRRHPGAATAVVLAALFAEGLMHAPFVVQPMVLVMVYTVAARLRWRASLPLAGASIAVYLLTNAVGKGQLSLPEVISAVVTVVAAYIVGIYFGTRAAYVQSLHSGALQMARERELLAQRAVAEERVRIARELHDVVAHHLSLITVQAAALQTQVPVGSGAHATAATMATTGRRAMDEMRRMLGVLRLGAATDAPGHAPQPGIADIPALVAQARQVGIDVDLDADPEPRAVPDGIDLSVYRIVQEALTNVIRHAPGARFRVSLHFAGDRLEIRIADDGGAPAMPARPGGQGLVGMRERVGLLEGEMSAGPGPEGGFVVAVSLPVPAGGPP